MKRILSREQKLISIAGIGVIVESFFSYYWIQQNIPQINKIGPLQALFSEIGIAIFIAIVVYVYSIRSEKIRQARLRRQIISSFEMLNTDFSFLATQNGSLSVHEEIITKKNLRIFHIQNLIGMLPEPLGKDLSLKIPELCEKALMIPMIIRPLDPRIPISVDYTNCERMVLDCNEIVKDLQIKWETRRKRNQN